MLEFKLNMYFEEYKDKPLPTREEFRKHFKDKHGEFQLVNELILKIEKYQFKKYGQTLVRGNAIIQPSKQSLKNAGAQMRASRHKKLGR